MKKIVLSLLYCEMSDWDSHQTEINLLIDVLNYLHPFSMNLNTTSMTVKELTIVNQLTVLNIISQNNYNAMMT